MSSIESLGDLRGKRVLVRSDLNVPLDGDLITDDGRIRASVPTIRSLADAGARVIVTAHLGRPKGAPDPAYSLEPVAARLGELLGSPVAFATDTVGESATETVASLPDGHVALLENVRFNAGETSKDEAERGAFADQLASLADGFVSDGFGVVHRKQASVYDVAQRLPHAMGGLVATEIAVLRRLTVDPERPFVVVLGGSKVSGKLEVLKSLASKVDTLIPGGGIANTLMAAAGIAVGKSLHEGEMLGFARELLAGKFGKVKIALPTDVVEVGDLIARAEQEHGSAERNDIAEAEDAKLGVLAVDAGAVGALQVGEHELALIFLDFEMEAADALVVELDGVAFLAADGDGRLKLLEHLAAVGAVEHTEGNASHRCCGRVRSAASCL